VATTFHLSGRVLFFSSDLNLLNAQLAGDDLTDIPLGGLRDDISTDEIIPLPAMVHFDEKLGRYPYTGLTVGGKTPIKPDLIRELGVQVVVGGKRYGKGSSREHSVVAEMSAGVKIVFAESFERLYRQNADNLGLWTSTDFSLLERVLSGDEIDLEEFLIGRDAPAKDIVRAGGLLAYGREALGGVVPVSTPGGAEPHSKPRTLFQKIVQAHRAVLPKPDGASSSFVWADKRFVHEYYTGMIDHLMEFAAQGRIFNPASVICFEDHLSYVHESPVHVSRGLIPLVNGLSQAHRKFVARHQLTHHGYRVDLPAGDPGNAGSEGISHAMMTERYALPGELVVGTDSHTTHLGAVGCVAIGIGSTDMANALFTGLTRVADASGILVRINGNLPAGVMAKDVVLNLLADSRIRQGAGIGRVFEFGGEAVQKMSVDERATLCNMVAELGGLTGIVAPDAQTLEFLQQRRGLKTSELPDLTNLVSDPEAPFERVFDIDASRMSPWVARPGDPGRGVALVDLPAEERPKIDIAYGGSCTAGKRTDFDAYFEVLKVAFERGQAVSDSVRLYLQFGTQDVKAYCEQREYLDVFSAVGAVLLEPACGACANCGPGVSTASDQVTISAINRNFPGRSGPGAVWLASPYTVAASALLGYVGSYDEWFVTTC
jgi:3-isopropylmalate/(R)-2-methylmalate dehydratase large subunit